MADYVSQFTGAEIDSRLRKAGTAVQPADLESKQDTLVSGENIKTVNGQSIVGSGNIQIQAGDTDAVKYVEQTLTDAQKEQARTNIAAASAAELGQIVTDLTGIEADIDSLEAAVQAIGVGDFVTATALPTASASTMGHIYLIGPDANNNYDRYFTQESGGAYSWVPLGSTQIDLSTYATQEEVSQLEAKVNRLFLDIGLADVNFDIHYTVTNNLSNCTTDNDDTTASLGESYEATITPDDGYDLSSVAVLMGNEDITEDVYDGEGGISIPAVEGDITITAIAVEHGVTVVTFADPIVEQIAYAQGWDDNGVFTTDSLAAVTRIDAVFKGTAIETFDEFQYFTGILAAYNQLAQDAFRGCTALTNIVIPENCPIYGNSIFQGCSSLTSIVVPDGVTKISGSFFRDCTSLVTIDLGKDIATIGNLWVQSDAAVTTLICRATTPPTADWSLFTGMGNLAHIYVPAASVDAYKAAANWSAKASIIEAIPE